jgi:hypothetical protein
MSKGGICASVSAAVVVSLSPKRCGIQHIHGLACTCPGLERAANRGILLDRTAGSRRVYRCEATLAYDKYRPLAVKICHAVIGGIEELQSHTYLMVVDRRASLMGGGEGSRCSGGLILNKARRGAAFGLRSGRV